MSVYDFVSLYNLIPEALGKMNVFYVDSISEQRCDMILQKMTFYHVFCNDIFETSVINPRIDYKGQWLRMDFSCYRLFGVSLIVKFGGYKAKKEKSVDISRFRQ